MGMHRMSCALILSVSGRRVPAAGNFEENVSFLQRVLLRRSAMRVCQPGPVAFHRAMTSAGNRSDINFRGLAETGPPPFLSLARTSISSVTSGSSSYSLELTTCASTRARSDFKVRRDADRFTLIGSRAGARSWEPERAADARGGTGPHGRCSRSGCMRSKRSAVRRKHVNELCNERRAVTAPTALILARVFGNSRVNDQQAARKSHRELGHEPDLEARAPLITLAATTPQIDITLNQH